MQPRGKEGKYEKSESKFLEDLIEVVEWI